ncbi:MAG: putative ABC transporter permease [Lachnospira sp.]
MRVYSVSQWLLFFFIYCFAGWIWESCYVSVRQKRWVNRGFLHGPFLPIYGSGAIVILISTIGVRNNPFLVFLFGMISSTILEFVTGCCMEKLFGVRYWDYSKMPLNVKGHICLFASIGWGLFSILLVCFAHKPVETAVLFIPKTISDIVAFVCVVAMSVDFTQSFNEAMNLKAALEKFTSSNEQFKTISRRLEIASAFAEDDYNKFKEKIAEVRAKGMLKGKAKLPLEHVLEIKKNVKLESIQDMVEKVKEALTNKSVDEKGANQILETLENEKHKVGSTSTKEYKSISRIIKRNPYTVSHKHTDALKEIKEIFK